MADDASAPTPQERPPGAVGIHCGTCGGSGTRIVERMALTRGMAGTLHVPSECRDCKGTGRCGWVGTTR